MCRRLLVLACLASFAVPACAGRSIRATDDGVMDDAIITARIKTSLLNDQQVGATKIDVTTVNGVVTLSGIVKSQAVAARAIELARQAPGVKDVKSMVQVTP
jgi:hyperosmotically inducible protein